MASCTLAYAILVALFNPMRVSLKFIFILLLLTGCFLYSIKKDEISLELLLEGTLSYYPQAVRNNVYLVIENEVSIKIMRFCRKSQSIEEIVSIRKDTFSIVLNHFSVSPSEKWIVYDISKYPKSSPDVTPPTPWIQSVFSTDLYLLSVEDSSKKILLEHADALYSPAYWCNDDEFFIQKAQVKEIFPSGELNAKVTLDTARIFLWKVYPSIAKKLVTKAEGMLTGGDEGKLITYRIEDNIIEFAFVDTLGKTHSRFRITIQERFETVIRFEFDSLEKEAIVLLSKQPSITIPTDLYAGRVNFFKEKLEIFPKKIPRWSDITDKEELISAHFRLGKLKLTISNIYDFMNINGK